MAYEIFIYRYLKSECLHMHPFQMHVNETISHIIIIVETVPETEREKSEIFRIYKSKRSVYVSVVFYVLFFFCFLFHTSFLSEEYLYVGTLALFVF